MTVREIERQIANERYFTHNGIKTHNQSESKFAPIGEYEGKVIVGCEIPKCACSTIHKLYGRYMNVPLESTNNEVFAEAQGKGLKPYLTPEQFPNREVIRVVRDPKERFLSMWKTIAPMLDYDEYVMLFRRAIRRLPILELNGHMAPQFYCDAYLRWVDTNVWIDDLDSFLMERGITPSHMNHRERGLTGDVPQDILDFYAKDYEMLNKIKIWKPT